MKTPVYLAQFSKKRIIVIGVVLLLLAASLLLRGWIRNNVVPMYVEATYGKVLHKLADQQIVPLNNKLAPVGLVFKKYTGYVPGKKCGLAYFHNLKETVVRSTGYSAEIIAPSTQQKDKLTAQGDTIEQWLKDNGWTKEGTSYERPVNALFDSDYASVFYQKHIGSTSCKFILSWLDYSTYASPSPTLSVTTDCTREVKFFGGNDSLHS